MAIYNSSYTGAEVDASVAKTQAITKTPQQINDLNQVIANPTLAGTWFRSLICCGVFVIA